MNELPQWPAEADRVEQPPRDRSPLVGMTLRLAWIPIALTVATAFAAGVPDPGRIIGAFAFTWLLAAFITALLVRRRNWGWVRAGLVFAAVSFVLLAAQLGSRLKDSQSAVAAQETYIQKMFDNIAGASEVLEQVHDTKTAKAAVPALEQRTAQMRAVLQARKGLEPVSERESERLLNLYMPKIQGAVDRYAEASQNALSKVGDDPDFRRALSDHYAEVAKLGEKK